MPSKIDREILAAIELMEPKTAKAFVAAINDIRSSAKLRRVEAAIRDGRITEAVELLNLTQAYFSPLDAAITAAFILGGAKLISGLPRKIPVRFSPRAPRADAWTRRRFEVLAGNLSREQRILAQDFITASIQAGKSHRAIALDLVGRINPLTGKRVGSLIGLARNQAESFINARNELLSGDPVQLRNYMKRALRDRRFDSIVKAAIEKGTPIKKTKADRIVGRYSERMLRARGGVIAHHETTAAVNAGKHEAMRQMLDAGEVSEDQVKRTWRTVGGPRVRDTHASMNGQVVRGLDAPFVSSSGARLMHPHDTSLGAGASEVANCRCREEVTIDLKPISRIQGVQVTSTFRPSP